MTGLLQGYWGSWSSCFYNMGMNEGYRSWDGTREPTSCLSGQNPPQFGIRLGYLTAQSKALFARILHCVAALEGADSSLTTPYSFHDREKVFDASKQFDTTTCSACSLQNLILNWLQLSIYPKQTVGILFRDWPPARLLGILALVFL